MQQQWLAFLTMCSHQLWPKSGLIPNTHIYNAMLACPSEVSCHTSLLLIGRFLIGLWAVRHCDQQHKLRGQFTTPLLPINISSQIQLSLLRFVIPFLNYIKFGCVCLVCCLVFNCQVLSGIHLVCLS